MSSLLLYEARAFQLLIPNPVTFGLPPTDADSKSDASLNNDGRLRVDTSHEYEKFKRITFPNHHGMDLVRRFNQEDFELYDFMQQLFCARVNSLPGLISAARGAGIALDELDSCRQLMQRSQAKTLVDLCPRSN